MNKHRLDREVIGRKLDQAMTEQKVGVRQLSEQIREKLGVNAPGTSYGALHLYRRARIYRPRVEVLEAAAEVLGLRTAWLIWDEGEPTLGDEYARRQARAAQEAIEREADAKITKRMEAVLIDEVPRFGEGAMPQTWYAVWELANYWISHPYFYQRNPSVLNSMLSSSKPGAYPLSLYPEVHEKAVREVARVLRAPAEAADIDLGELSNQHLNLYVAAAKAAILTLITLPEQLQRRKPLRQHSGDSLTERE